MKVTTTICNLCGAVMTEGGSVIAARAGNLSRYLDEPLDVCPACEPKVLALLRPEPKSADGESRASPKEFIRG
jgi:hypothetical protein